MSAVSKVCIGHKAPYFQCEAVVKGAIEEVSLNDYIQPTIKPGSPNPNAPWLIILFIPAVFSFVCPTEVLAFQDCLEEFKDRNCNIVFVSVDTKHSLWHWQNVPRQYGGLGEMDIPLLSDSNHRLAKDYGVLIEEEGISLRGMFILDGEGIVQQITLNNLTVGRSVLEALRLLEAFQAVGKPGVLCPIDWKPNENASEIKDTISNTLTESYEERLANLQREFEGMQVTGLDAKHKSDDSHNDLVTNGSTKRRNENSTGGTPAPTIPPIRSHSSPQPPTIQQICCSCPAQSSSLNSHHNDCLPQMTPTSLNTPRNSFSSARSSSAPQSLNITPSLTPTRNATYPPTKRQATARHSRGTHPQPLDPRYMNNLFSQAAPSLFRSMSRRVPKNSSSGTHTSPGHSTAPLTPLQQMRPKSAKSVPPRLASQNTHEPKCVSHFVLEFADATASSPQGQLTPTARPAWHSRPSSQDLTPALSCTTTSYQDPSNGWSGTSSNLLNGHLSPLRTSPTRLQTTFEAIKKGEFGIGET